MGSGGGGGNGGSVRGGASVESVGGCRGREGRDESIGEDGEVKCLVEARL